MGWELSGPFDHAMRTHSSVRQNQESSQAEIGIMRDLETKKGRRRSPRAARTSSESRRRHSGFPNTQTGNPHILGQTPKNWRWHYNHDIRGQKHERYFCKGSVKGRGLLLFFGLSSRSAYEITACATVIAIKSIAQGFANRSRTLD